jgi:hypothetical protein
VELNGTLAKLTLYWGVSKLKKKVFLFPKKSVSFLGENCFFFSKKCFFFQKIVFLFEKFVSRKKEQQIFSEVFLF